MRAYEKFHEGAELDTYEQLTNPHEWRDDLHQYDTPFEFPYSPTSPVFNDYHLNLHHRLVVRQWCNRNAARQELIRRCCSADILWFFNTFLWVYEPRKDRKVWPFITWRFQDPAIIAIERGIDDSIRNENEKVDIGIEKSRDLGATWCFLAVFFKRWLFHGHENFGLTSREEDLVDSTERTDTLFWKCDFMYKNLPAWMRPKMHRRLKQMTNLDNGAVIEGDAPTKHLFRGGRKTAVGVDEWAAFDRVNGYEVRESLQHATGCRVVISTPIGAENAYYEFMHDTQSSLRKVVLDWRDHPDRSKGLYRVERGQVVQENREFPLTPEQLAKLPDMHSRLRQRGFELEGTIRSPYYDSECLRPGATPKKIAQELDRDYLRSGNTVLPPALKIRILEEMIRPPAYRMRIDAESDTLKIVVLEDNFGECRIWCPLDSHRQPMRGRKYAAGADISYGTSGEYSSNSSLIVLDCVTGEQVLSYASNRVGPTAFADLCMSVCKWFNNAFFCWERNGGGGLIFTNRVLEQGYPHVYFENVEKTVIGRKKTKRPGWRSEPSGENKQLAINSVISACDGNQTVIREKDTLDEFGEYIFQNGKVIHQRYSGAPKEDASHGDRVIAYCMAWIALNDQPEMSRKDESFQDDDREAPWGSLAWIREQMKKEQANSFYSDYPATSKYY